MNKVILMGRLVRDPDVKYSQGDEPVAVARYALAVNRRFKKQGDQDADLIYTTDVVVDEHYFAESKKDGSDNDSTSDDVII